MEKVEPVNIQDMYEIAKQKLPKSAWDYYSSGADDQFTLRDTRRAFESIKLKARALANADAWEGTETSILGFKISSPICIAPAAFQKLATPEGEVSTARAANKTRTAMGLSSWTSSPPEAVGEAAPDIPKIF